MAGNKRKSSDSLEVEEQEEVSAEASPVKLGRGRRERKVSRKLIMSEEDRKKEAARLELKLAKLRSATVIPKPPKVTLKSKTSSAVTGKKKAAATNSGQNTKKSTAIDIDGT